MMSRSGGLNERAVAGRPGNVISQVVVFITGVKLTISDQVNPQELDGNERLWHAQGGGKEDADNFANV